MGLLISSFLLKIRQGENNMFDLLTETFIYEYYLYQAILGKFFMAKEIFVFLSEIFCLKNNEELFTLMESEAIQRIQNENDFKQYKRIKQFNTMTSSIQMNSIEEETIIAIKGKAIMDATKNKLYCHDIVPTSFILNRIYQGVEKGNILAIRIFGTLECLGVLVEKNINDGIKQLNKATQWGDFSATLSLLKFDIKHRDRTLKMLNSIILDTPYQQKCSLFFEAYKIKTNENSERILLLKKAFGLEELQPDIYHPLAAKLIFESNLEIKEIEKIILSQNKNLLLEARSLPLIIPQKDIIIKDNEGESFLFDRKEEMESLHQLLKRSVKKVEKESKPIGIYGEDIYVLTEYSKYLYYISQENHVVQFDVNNLSIADFELNSTHIFIRSVSEYKPTIYILKMIGSISNEILELVADFLQTEKRKCLHLTYPAVSLDLSSVLPICICDKRNEEKLKSFLDMIPVSKISAKEKSNIIQKILNEKESQSIKSIQIDSKAIESLLPYSIPSIIKVIDNILCDSSQTEKTILLTYENIYPWIQHLEKIERTTAFGFGGLLNENN